MMKKIMRFLPLSVLCLAAISVSSCLNSSDESDILSVIVSAQNNSGSVTFTDVAGNTYVPTSLTIDGHAISVKDSDIVFIYYTLNGTTATSLTTNKYKVTLTGFYDLETTYNNHVFNISKGSADDSITNFHFAEDSLISVSRVTMLGSHLWATLMYNPNVGGGNYNNLFYYTDQGLSLGNGTVPDTLKVWLCHHSIGTLSSHTSYNYSGSYPYMYYFGYDLTKALAAAKSLTSKDSVIVDMKARVVSSVSNGATWTDNACSYRFNKK